MHGKQGLARFLVEGKDKAHLCQDNNGAGGLVVVGDGAKDGLSGEVVVPDIAVDGLKAPLELSGCCVDSEEGVGKFFVGSRAGCYCSVGAGTGRGDEHGIGAGVGGHDSPCVCPPGSFWCRVEFPEKFSGAGIEGAYGAIGCFCPEVVGDAGADNNRVVDNGGWGGDGVLARIDGGESFFKVDYAFVAEGGVEFAGLGIEGDESAVVSAVDDRGFLGGGVGIEGESAVNQGVECIGAGSVDFWIVLPFERARFGIEGNDAAERGGEVECSFLDDGSALE